MSEFRQQLADLYDLDTQDLQDVYEQLEDLVDEALHQFGNGLAVDVEQRMADMAKALVARRPQ
jgi:uncharacterized tellurite resistance protein B-like protein